MLKKVIVYGIKCDKNLEMVRENCESVLVNYEQSVLIRADEAGINAITAAGYRVRELPVRPKVSIGGYEVDTMNTKIRSTRANVAETALPSGRSNHILCLIGPMHPDWKSQLERMGTVFYQAIDEFHCLVQIENSRLDDLQALDFVDSVCTYHPSLKINPVLLTKDIESTLVTTEAMTSLGGFKAEKHREKVGSSDILEISRTKITSVNENEVGNIELFLFDPKDQIPVFTAVQNLGAKVISGSGASIIIFADLKILPQLAAIPQIREVNPYRPPHLHNNVATGIIHVDTLRNDHGLDGQGQIVGIGDTGLDTGVSDATMLADFQGRIVSIYSLGRPGDASDTDGHGTHVAGSVLGDGANSNGNIKGMAPEARVVFQSIMDASGGLGGIPANLGMGLFDVARDDGARIHTNSWGADDDGAYTINSNEADTFAFNNREFLIIFAAGNDATNKVGSPATAKNVLTVGASESLRSLPASVQFPNSPRFPASDFPGGPVLNGLDQDADDQNQVTDFSSIGPAQNNRRKPDVVAPGSWILSTRSSVSVYDSGPDGLGAGEVGPGPGFPAGGTGDEDGVATHNEAVGMGLPGLPVFRAGNQNTPAVPPGSGATAAQNYMYISGTSMATPITAGTCALVRQYLIEQRGHTPSAALLKALMINGSVDMGMGIPHTGQGWGRIDLDNILFPTGTNRIQFDDSLNSAVATGDIRTYDVFVSAITAPFAVTLVWRDPASNTIQNRLHLRVIHVGSSTTSTSDDIANIRNNVQKVVIDPPQVGLYHIEVEGVSVGTGVPELAGLRQDYALVISNATGFSCNPSDIVQVIDRSGSMGFSGYMEPAKERAKQMVDILQINDKMGVVTFAASATAGVPYPLTLINSQNVKDDIHNAINLVTSSGMTDLREALSDGLSTLGADSGRPRAMVFLSDGKHTVLSPEIDDLFLDSIATSNVKVYTIALGPASDFPVLNNIANRTGTGSVYTVDSAADLHKLHEIYYDILGSVGCGGVVHLNSAEVDLRRGLTQSVSIDNTVREAHFAISWESIGAEFVFSLQAPSGDIYDAKSNHVFHYRGSTYEFYRIPKPEEGVWKLIVKSRAGSTNQPPRVTTAVLADSDIKCVIRLDTKFLFRDKILIYLNASYLKKPVTGGNATAIITYPTQSTESLLANYAQELKEIRLDKDKLSGDVDDEALIKLGILAAQFGAKGKDIFERKTTKVRLTDDGREEDNIPKDGVYTAFFNPKKAGVAGNFQVQVLFEANDRFGTHTCTKLIPVHVPQLVPSLSIEDISASRFLFWGQWSIVVVRAKVSNGNGQPATPDDGVEVSMTMSQGDQKLENINVPYNSDGQNFNWFFWDIGFRSGKANVTVQAKQGSLVVTETEIVTI